jgi:Peptidase family M48
MSFLGWPAEKKLPSRRSQLRRRSVTLALLDEFGRAFPEITYDLLWESPTINAQAWRVGTVRHVRVYGGLARHLSITRPGLALMIAHETGHHLGGLPRDPTMRWMTWQGQADYWAARTAMPFVFGSQAHDMTLRGARQILRLHEELVSLLQDDEPDMTAQCRYHIFCAGASGSEIPPCAKAEYRRSFDQEYPVYNPV